MTDIVIKAENLGKKYVIGHQAERGGYTALRDVLMQNARTLWNKTKDLATGKPIIQGDTMEEVWALKDVSFEIRRGEAVGIIGRNGAGKSTLLKILSRITEPSTGRVTIKGRVASLLEVGTGFHPELTGRENIYLNGTILGMTRVEIKQKFDEIVAFAEVEKYLDTPVKRYSSGMYVRLAFAVAAHLEPEILVVDEVLAVGDAQFQKKCLGKMGDVAHEGRTVLFVSHNMGAIKTLCKKGIVLEQGNAIYQGGIDKAVSNYTAKGASSFQYIAPAESDKPFIREVVLLQGDENSAIISIDEPFTIRYKIEKHNRKELVTSILVNNSQDLCVLHSSNEFSAKPLDDFEAEIHTEVPAYALGPGKYSVDISLGQRNYELYEDLKNILVFEVEFTGPVSDRTIGDQWRGICGPGLLKWY